MHGLHLTADLHRCPPGLALMTDPQALHTLCLHEVKAAGLQAVNALFHRFEPAGTGPAGITGVVLLAESHLAIHTWPELDAVTLDIYVCNFSADNREAAEALMQSLLAAFGPEHVERHRLQRGAAAA
jgi:S-adenosylmethionine decarboxylase proenzyme